MVNFVEGVNEDFARQAANKYAIEGLASGAAGLPPIQAVEGFANLVPDVGKMADLGKEIVMPLVEQARETFQGALKGTSGPALDPKTVGSKISDAIGKGSGNGMGF